MAKIRVACNATGYCLKPVKELLWRCQFIFTSNKYMVPVLDMLFPNARILVVLQDMKNEMIRNVLLAARLIEEQDEIECVSALQLYNKTLEEIGGEPKDSEDDKAVAKVYHEAVRKMVDLCQSQQCKKLTKKVIPANV